MLSGLPKSAQAYHQLYSGKTLMVELGDIEIGGETYAGLLQNMRELAADHIRLVLTIGDSVPHADVNEVVLLAQEGGVRDASKNVVPLMTERSIARVLEGRHPTISVQHEMRARLQRVLTLLPLVGKVAITSAAGLKGEIENWRGSGTLCVDSGKCTMAKLTEREEPIFDQVYSEFVKSGIFRVRSADELRQLKNQHRLLMAKNSPLGGYSLMPRDKGWQELSALWAGSIGNGIGQMLISQAKQEVQSGLIALSNQEDAIRAFEAGGFSNLGAVSQLQTLGHCSTLPTHIEKYDTEKRDPAVLTYSAQQA